MITINHISLLTKEPLLPIVVNELTFNGYNLGIFLTLMLLIQQWAVIPLSIDRLKSEKYARIARTAFYSVTMIIGSTLITTDLTLFTNPEAVADTIISFQHHLWGIACLLNGVLYGIFGYSLIRSLSQTIAQNEDNCTRSSGFEKHKEEKIRQEKSLLLKFKLIYYLYVSISGPYAVLYFIVIYVKSDPFTVWLLVYTVFNMAGPLTALILAPISYR